MRRNERATAALAAALVVAVALVVALAVWQDGAADRAATSTPSSERGGIAPELAIASGSRDDSAGEAPFAPEAEREAAAVVEDGEASQASSRRRTELRGRVVDVTGEPIAGARVLAARERERRSAPLDAAPWAEARRETSTDAEGRFAFADFEPGRLRLAVRASGYAPFDSDAWRVAGEETLDLGDLVLALGVRIDGRVVDARGAPVAGVALIRAQDELRLFSDADPFDIGPVVAESGAQGEFAIDVQAAGPWILVARHSAHPDLVARGATQAPGERASLLLRFAEGTSIAGRVIGIPDDAETWVVRARSESPDDGSRTPRFAREAACDASGSFRVEGVVPDQWYVVRAEPRRGDGQRGADPIRVPGGEEQVELFVPRPIEVLARVTDAASGALVSEPEAEMDLYAPDGSRRRSLSLEREPGPGGATRFVSYGSVGNDATAEVEIHATGYLAVRKPGLALEAGRAIDLGAVALAPLGAVRLRAIDSETGEPLASAIARGELAELDTGRRRDLEAGRVRDPAAARSAASASIASLPSGADGVVELFGRAGASVVVRVEHPERVGSALIDAVFGARDAAPLDVALGVGATLEVEVVDTHGNAAAEVEVDLASPRPPVPERGYLIRPKSRSAVTDEAGRCTFEHLAPAAYAVVARVERPGAPLDPAVARQRSAEIAITGTETALVRLVVPARARVTGRVTERGRALVGATVGLIGSERVRLEFAGELLRELRVTARTDAAGRYEFADVAEGQWTIAVSHASRALPSIASCVITAPEEVCDVDLSLSIVEGEVLDRRGRPIAGARIRFLVPEPGARDANRRTELVTAGPLPATDEAGLFALRGIPAGYDLTLAFAHPDFVGTERKLGVLGPDEARSGVTVRMDRAGSVEVELVAASGTVARVPLFAQRLDPKTGEPRGARVGNVRTGSDGRGRIGGLAAGKWRVGARRGGAEPVYREIEVRAEDVVSVRIALD